MAEMAGFFYPRTAAGRWSLLPAPPWYYSGDLLTVEYRTDPAKVAALLPAPLEPAPSDPGAAGYYRQVGVTWDGGRVLANLAGGGQGWQSHG